MTIMARRFTILCLTMSMFAIGLSIVMQHSARRGSFHTIGLSAPCPQPTGIHCRGAL